MFTGCCLYHFIQSCNLLVNVNIVCVYYNGAEGMANQYAKPKAKVLRCVYSSSKPESNRPTADIK